MIYGFTGHRPPKLGGYGKEAQQKLYNFAHHTLRQNLKLCDPSINYIGDSAIIGMAQGWDLVVAQACHVLGIPYTAAIPFPGQESVWPDLEVRNLYTLLVENAAHKIYIHPTMVSYARIGEVSDILQLRNQYIVDHSDKMIALYSGDINGSTIHAVKGGTYRCIRYAVRQKKEIINVWKDWEAFS